MSTTLKRTIVGVLALACLVPPAAAIAGGKAEKMKARMTGGGWVYGKADGVKVKVTHGFSLYCRTATQPQRLEINWSGGNSYHLTTLTDSYCAEEGYDQENPEAPFDTYYGEGTGKLNFGSGDKDTGTATWRFVDNGEPGSDADRIQIVITDSDGNEVLRVNDKALHNGNHQAHRGTGSKA